MIRRLFLCLLSISVYCEAGAQLAPGVGDPLVQTKEVTGGPTQAQSQGIQESDQSGFAVLGAGIGSPSGVVLVGGYYCSPFALRLSGGSWGKSWNGWQADLGVNLSRGSFFAQGLSLIGGRWTANPVLPDKQGMLAEQVETQSYLGIAYDMYVSGLFVQMGLAFPRQPAGPAEAAVQLAFLIGMR
jgi:hypothetical protein